jgi:hypothetical protein
MTAKEKAKEIINLFTNVSTNIDNDYVKNCALISIDLIIESIKRSGEYSAKSQIDWWNLVKSDLQSL